MMAQLTLHTYGSQSLVLSLDHSDLEELCVTFNNVPEDSKLYPFKQELDSAQWFQDHAVRGIKPYY